MAVPNQISVAARLLGDVVSLLRASYAGERFHSPRPPAAGLVVDLGSGQGPHPRADLIVDKYVADDFERGGSLVIEKPLVVGDGHALPLADGAFHYLVTAHVLEHATDPVRFAAEMQRVAAAGFIQVPSREAELTFGWPFHPWLIDLQDGVLVFNPRGDAAAPIGELFHRAAAESPTFTLWFAGNRSRWHHTVHWEGSFEVRVTGESAAPQTADLDIERTLAALPRMGARGPDGPLRDRLRCPVDRGQLTSVADTLACSACDRAYPVAGGVPVLLAEAAG